MRKNGKCSNLIRPDSRRTCVRRMATRFPWKHHPRVKREWTLAQPTELWMSNIPKFFLKFLCSCISLCSNGSLFVRLKSFFGGSCLFIFNVFQCFLQSERHDKCLKSIPEPTAACTRQPTSGAPAAPAAPVSPPRRCQ